jgi:hypothetical protein
VEVDKAQVPYIDDVIDGRPAEVAPRGHVFRFYGDDGRPVFTRKIKALPAHDLFGLGDDDLEVIGQKIITQIDRQ